MFAESEYVSIPMRLTVGSVSFPSTSRELISSSRNSVISSTFSSPMLPDVSRANTTSEPSKQADNNTHTNTAYDHNNGSNNPGHCLCVEVIPQMLTVVYTLLLLPSALQHSLTVHTNLRNL